jgi:hypothetical protein
MRFFAGYRITVWIFTSTLSKCRDCSKIFATLLFLVILKPKAEGSLLLKIEKEGDSSLRSK